MNAVKRAILYIERKKKKSLLILFIIFTVSTLVLAGGAIRDAQEEALTELRGTTGTSFTVSRNTATGGWGNSSAGSYSTQEFLSDVMVENIGHINGIEGYNASIRSILSLANTNGEWMEQLEPIGHVDVDCQFYSYGCINSEYNSMFLSGALAMCDGNVITSDKENGIIISKDIAKKHGLKIGDTIQAMNDPYSNDKTLKLEIIGLFEIVADKTDDKNNYNEASYYDYANYAFVSESAMKELLTNYDDAGYSSADFFVADPQELETVIQNVQNIPSINWNNFVITANDEVYERTADSMSNIGTLITTLIIIVVSISIAIVILVLSMQMKSREREIGIFLAVGIGKPAILIQYLLEVLFLAAIAFPASFGFGKLIAGNIGSLFGKPAENIIVTSHYFFVVAGFGTLLLMAAVAVSCLPVMRYKPKEILTHME